MHPHERLEAWQACRQLTLAIHRISRRWPRDEIFVLTSQIRRAALSIESNIAEGVAKRGSREFRRFLDISIGSLAEVTSQLSLAHALGYIDDDGWNLIEPIRASASKLTWLLYKSVSRRASRSLGG